jgi:uncharacterized DUF497 family protein
MIGLIEFSWDFQKDEINQLKHGVSFDEAKTVFWDPDARLLDDPSHSISEDRFILLGLSEHFNLLLVCHCYRESDFNIRIISARKATKNEAMQYGKE